MFTGLVQDLGTVASLALLFTMIGVSIYIWIRFEWQFGIAAITTLILDATKTIGFMVLFQVEFNLTTIAGILAEAGVIDNAAMFRLRARIEGSHARAGRGSEEDEAGEARDGERAADPRLVREVRAPDPAAAHPPPARGRPTVRDG